MLLKGGRGSLYFHMGLIGIDVTRNGIEPSSRLRSALQQNLIAFMVMALALPLKTGRVEGIGGGKKTKYQNVFTNVFRTTLENIIEHHRMFSNLLSRMRARSRPLLSPASLSPSPFLSFRIFPRGNFITYIAKHFHESRARFDPDASLMRNRESHPRD